MLRAGETRIRVGSEWTSLATGPGYFKIQRDRAIALVDDAVKAEDIDVEQARAQADEARALLERADAGEEGIDRWLAEQRLRHAENKLGVAGKG
jgi:F0F1-type ATP synthase epsilon subunit